MPTDCLDWHSHVQTRLYRRSDKVTQGCKYRKCLLIMLSQLCHSGGIIRSIHTSGNSLPVGRVSEQLPPRGMSHLVHCIVRARYANIASVFLFC